jgi:thiamine kinase-like enzyme
MSKYMTENFSHFESMWKSTIGDKTMNLFESAVNSCQDSFETLKSPPTTLIHGDFKLPNMFWDDSAGGKPILIDWQYATTGKGIEDIVFMLVESCPIGIFADLAKPIINLYYDKIQRASGATILNNVRIAQTKCALSCFPLFVAIWFGTIDRSRLVDPNFPFLYITRLANAFRTLCAD